MLNFFQKEKSTPDVKIVMIGPSGTGKTSLLAAMFGPTDISRSDSSATTYDIASLHLGDHSLVPKNDDASEGTTGEGEELTTGYSNTTGKKLKTKLGELIQFTKDLIPVKGTEIPEPYNFDLQYDGLNGKKVTELHLQITDTRGGSFTESNSVAGIAQLEDSDASFWCIDSIKLGEATHYTHNYNLSNELDAMVACLEKSKISEGHTVIIVLLRVESFANHTQGQGNKPYTEIVGKLESKIALPLLKLISSNSKIGTVYYCAVETTGCVKYQGSDTKPFRTDGTFAPRNCEAPVLCAVQQALKKRIRDLDRKIFQVPFLRFFPTKTVRKLDRLRRRSKKLDTVIEQHIEGGNLCKLELERDRE